MPDGDCSRERSTAPSRTASSRHEPSTTPVPARVRTSSRRSPCAAGPNASAAAECAATGSEGGWARPLHRLIRELPQGQATGGPIPVRPRPTGPEFRARRPGGSRPPADQPPRAGVDSLDAKRRFRLPVPCGIAHAGDSHKASPFQLPSVPPAHTKPRDRKDPDHTRTNRAAKCHLIHHHAVQWLAIAVPPTDEEPTTLTVATRARVHRWSLGPAVRGRPLLQFRRRPGPPLRLHP